MQLELEWAQARPSSQAHLLGHKLCLDDDEPFARALTFAEERFRASYAESKPNQCWQLNQNPDAGFGASSTDHCLPTVIANVHVLYTERVSPARWMLGSEALCTQGFPVLPGLWGLGQDEFPCLCSFNLPKKDRTSRRLLIQAGDSMNQCVGVAWADTMASETITTSCVKYQTVQVCCSRINQESQTIKTIEWTCD